MFSEGIRALYRCTPPLMVVILLLTQGAGAVWARTSKAAARYQHLFNGKDLTGWDTWLGIPRSGLVGLEVPHDDKGEYTEPLGLNRDPLHVFSVVKREGKPAIRISGEIFGALTSVDEYENFHLRVVYRWGEKKWPPRENEPRDSGVLYHSVGPFGTNGKGREWMRSHECQIQEHDVGDFWSVASAAVDVTATPCQDREKRAVLCYARTGQTFTRPAPPGLSRIIKLAENDRLNSWNTVEVISVNGTIWHVVNGKVVMVLTNPRQLVDGKEVPLTRGKLQLQSEGSEIFYRSVEIQSIDRLPSGYGPGPK